MQSSSSFEYARTGRKRPTNLLPGRTSSFELPLSSPSFNAEHVINGTPTRGSQAGTRDDTHCSPAKQYHTGAGALSVPSSSSPVSMPPTPITAGLPLEDAPARRSAVTLPGIGQMLAAAPLRQSVLTPPSSTRVPMGPRIGCDDETARFDGPRPQWVQDEQYATFSDVRHVPAPQRGSSSARTISQVSPNRFHDVIRDEEEKGTVGLGFVSTDDAPTPRIGSFGRNALGLYTAATPTQAQLSQKGLMAPTLEQEEDGCFPDTIPSSPISPPLRGWNTDLQFSDDGFAAPSPRLTSVAMEREQHVVLQGVMPSQMGLRGLGISLDGSDMELDDQARASTSNLNIVDNPPTPTRSISDALYPTIASTGLTPSLSSARITNVHERIGSSPSAAAKSPSPSLRTKSKKRSDLVRREAEAAVSAVSRNNSSASPPHRAALQNLSPPAHASIQDEGSVLSPRKRSLNEDDCEVDTGPVKLSTPSQKVKSSSRGKSSTSPSTKPSSPWGIFRVKEEGWKSLGPPGGGKALGVSAVRGSTIAKPKSSAVLETAPVSKKQRKAVAGSSSAASFDTAKRNQENKENIPPSSTHSSSRGSDQAQLVGKYRRSASANLEGPNADVFGSEARLAPNRPSLSSAGRRTSVSRPISAPSSGAAPRRRL